MTLESWSLELRGMLEGAMQAADSTEPCGSRSGEGEKEAPKLTLGLYLDLLDAVH